MVTIPGPTHRQVAKHADELSALMYSSLRRVAGRIADHMSGRVLTAAANPTLDDLGPTRVEWTQQVDDQLLPYVGETYQAGAQQVAAGLRDALPVGAGLAVPSVASEDAELYLSGRRNALVGVGDDLWSTMRNELSAGFQAGESVPELAARVRSAADFTQARADVVARTEANSAANRGSIDQMRATGLRATKTWVATFDARTRPSHAEANGQSVALNEMFDVGGESLDEPGDESASAAEVANCRCSVTYEVGDEDITSLVDGQTADEELIANELRTLQNSDELALADALNSGIKLPTGDVLRDIRGAVADWTGADYATSVPRRIGSDAFQSALSRAYSDPLATTTAARFLRTVAGASSEDVELYRGVKDVPLTSVPSVGQTFDIGASSFTSSVPVAEGFTIPLYPEQTGASVIFRVESGSRALKIEKLAGDYKDQREHVALGGYRVVGRTDEKRTFKLYDRSTNRYVRQERDYVILDVRQVS